MNRFSVPGIIVAQDDDWILFSIDVSKAFAKGLSFEELARFPHLALSVSLDSGFAAFQPRDLIFEREDARLRCDLLSLHCVGHQKHR